MIMEGWSITNIFKLRIPMSVFMIEIWIDGLKGSSTIGWFVATLIVTEPLLQYGFATLLAIRVVITNKDWNIDSSQMWKNVGILLTNERSLFNNTFNDSCHRYFRILQRNKTSRVGMWSCQSILEVNPRLWRMMEAMQHNVVKLHTVDSRHNCTGNSTIKIYESQFPTIVVSLYRREVFPLFQKRNMYTVSKRCRSVYWCVKP